MHIWMGECHVHAGINGQDLKNMVAAEPEAELFIHPECGCATSAMYLASSGAVPAERTHILSTSGMITAAQNTRAKKFWLQQKLECCISYARQTRWSFLNQ
jgi:quinolinate synthase